MFRDILDIGTSGKYDTEYYIDGDTEPNGDHSLNDVMSKIILDNPISAVIVLPPGNITLSSKIDITRSNITIVGKGEGISTILVDNAIGNNDVIDIHGSGLTGSAANLTANGNAGAQTVTVSTGDSANFAVGDFILVRSTATFISGGDAKQGEIHKVIDVNTGTGVITLDSELYDTYTTGNTANIIKVSMIQNIILKGFTIKKGPTYSGTGKFINNRYVENLKIENVSIEDAVGSSGSSISISNCFNSKVNKCNLIQNPSNSYNSQWGIEVTLCSQNTIISDCIFQGLFEFGVRTNSSSSAGSEGLPRNLGIVHCVSNTIFTAHYNIKIDSEGVTISNCSMYGSRANASSSICYGIINNAKGTTITGCHIQNIIGRGIYISGGTFCLISNIIIFKIYKNGDGNHGQGIEIASGISDVTINSCHIKDTDQDGILFAGNNDRIKVTNNFIDSPGRNNANDYGINVASTGSDDCVITSNIFRTTTVSINQPSSNDNWIIVGNDFDTAPTISGTGHKISANKNLADNLASGVIDREFNQAVNTTATETTIFTHTITANLLQTNKILKFLMAFNILNNTGSSTPDVILRVKFGGTTIYAAEMSNITASSTRQPGFMMLLLANRENTAIQVEGGFVMVNNESTSGVTAGIGAIDDDEFSYNGPHGGNATEDTTSNKDFVVTIQFSTSDANLEFLKNVAMLELA